MGTDEEQNWNYVSSRHQRRRNQRHNKIDIAMSRRGQRENKDSQTTFFFTDFPESFGAKAMANVFQNYGDIAE
ncbi:hypothetical protein A2U01_0082784, partial [Trifolium medium]|nr:hypothetical protein [Trifolium medium]